MIKITTDWLGDQKYNSVTDYCRDLVRADILEEDTKIEVYRDGVISYTVLSVYEAAKIEPSGDHFRPYRKRGKGH